MGEIQSEEDAKAWLPQHMTSLAAEIIAERVFNEARKKGSALVTGMYHGIDERRDIYRAVIMAPIDDDGNGWFSFCCGVNGITEVSIVARKGPNDWIPYVQVWKGEHLHAEAAQHQAAWIEFLPDPRIEP